MTVKPRRDLRTFPLGLEPMPAVRTRWRTGERVRLGIATKIFVGFSGLLVGVVLLSSLSVQEIRRAADDLRAIRDGHLALARIVAQLQTHQQNRLRDLRRAVEEPKAASRSVILRIAVTYYPEVIESGIEAMTSACGRLIAQNDSLRDRTFCRGLAERTRPLEQASVELDTLAKDLETSSLARTPLASFASQLAARGETLRAAMFELDRFLRTETDQAVARAAKGEVDAIWRVFISTLGALSIGLTVTLLAARTLAPIKPLVRYARALVRGDYQQPLEVDQGEFADLADELRRMAKARDDREEALDRQAKELENAYIRVEELKRYHESIVRSLRTGIVVTDRQGRITSTNRAANAQWSLDRLTGQKLSDVHLGQALEPHFGALDEHTSSTPTTAEAIRLREKLADVTLAPLENERGEVMGLVIALEDVTEAVQTKEALLRSERLAAIGRMSAHVTHELRNPLASISLNAELLEELSSDAIQGQSRARDAEEAQQLCRAIGREADRLNALAEEYLRFARLPRPELVPTSPETLLRPLAAFIFPDCRAASVHLQVDIEPNLPEIRIDPDQLRQALLNLLRNGKESMPEGGELLLGARRGEEESIELFVKDQGSGIPADVRDRIFDPFYSTKLTGTGLGLALTQQIVQEHGAGIRVVSNPGQGSEFTVSFEAYNPSRRNHS